MSLSLIAAFIRRIVESLRLSPAFMAIFRSSLILSRRLMGISLWENPLNSRKPHRNLDAARLPHTASNSGDSTMPSPKKAKAKPHAQFSDWETPRITGLLVLADGTVIEGQGFGAEGEAVGEVCFNTAMTGYQEVLTDPSYAGQIVTFTFPHIGNVGTNDDDMETTNLAASAASKAASSGPPSPTRQLPLGQAFRQMAEGPQHHRPERRRHPRTHQPHPRKGMPNGVIAHNAKGKFDVKKLSPWQRPGAASRHRPRQGCVAHPAHGLG